MNSSFEILHRAVCALAERNADHATIENGIGYNGTDSSFGNSIALIPLERWTPGELHRVSRMLKKYAKQLAGYGIDLADAPEPPEADYLPRTNRYITTADGFFVIAFKFNDAIRMDVRAINGWKYNGGDKSWSVPVAKSSWDPLKALIRDYEFEVSETAGFLLDALERGWEPEPPKPEIVIVDTPVIIKPEPMKKIYIDTRRFMIEFDYNPVLVQEIKDSIPGRKWVPDKKVWSAPLTKEVAIALATFAEKHNFEVLLAAKEQMQGIVAVQTANLIGSRAETSDFEVQGLTGTLRPFQKAGVEYMCRVKRGVIGDDMGLGKTIEAIATAHHLDAYPVLVIAPATLKRVWEREWKKWVPYKSVAVWDSKGGLTADVVIVNYDLLTKLMDKLVFFDPIAVILDEFHYCKTHNSARTTSCKELCKDREVVIGLTGTMVKNRPSEALSQLSIIDRLDDLGGFWAFATRYCEAKRNRYGLDLKGSANLEEMNQKLRECCYIRRRKEDVLKELPALQHAVIPVEISNRAEYQAAERDVIGHIRELARSNRGFHASIAHLSPEAKAEAIRERGNDAAYRAAKAQQLTRIEALKQLVVKGKWDAVKKWGEDKHESGEKFIWFAWHTETVNELAAEWGGDAITGETPLDDRDTFVQRFQNTPEITAIAMNIQAGGVGITLTAASNVVFVEQPWTPADVDQAAARAHRMGQVNPVTAWHLVGVDTIEDDIVALINAKRKVTDAVINGTAQTEIDFDIMDALIERLANRAV